MKSNQEEFLKMLSAYQSIIHKVNQIYFRSKADKEENFQEVVCQLWRSFPYIPKQRKTCLMDLCGSDKHFHFKDPEGQSPQIL